jgi:hypothetical protein
MDSSTRQMTATTGRTVLAIVAILSLLLSAFAIARPVIAAHDDGTPEVTGTRDESRENEGGNITACLDGATLVRFGTAEASGSASGTIDGIPYTIEYTITDGKLTFVATGALVTEALIKGGPATTIYDYSGFPGGGIAHDDGLFATEGGISNVGFCLIPIEASILIYKTDQTQADVAGATFTVYDGETVVGGPTATDANGLACFDGLILDKSYTVVETTVPEGYIGADSQTVAASLGNCEDRITAGDAVDATFTNTLLGAIVIYKTDQTGADVADAVFTVEGKEGTFTTGADGTFCVDGLVVGDTVTVTETDAPDGYELANPASQEVDVTQAGDCEDHNGTPDATFTNNLLGSLLVLKTDDSEEPLEGAEFSITGPGEFSDTATSDADGWFCIDGLTFGAEYTVTETDAPDGYQMDTNNPQTHVIDDSATCAERVADSPVADLVFVNVEDVEEEDGSITINKVIDCEECETRTIGYWFNAGGSHDEETNALLAEFAMADDGSDPELVEINIDGTVHTFADAQDVRDFIAADQAGDDGEPGLSRDGQLLRQYLAVQLNVLLNGDECDLATRMLGDQSVADVLLEAEAALAADNEAAEVAAIEKLTAINESDDADENPLTCEGTEATPVDGFHFDLYTEAGYEAGDDPIDSGTTTGGGTLTFEPLPYGTYVIVETGNDLGLDCEVVAVLSGGTLNADGSITVTIDEVTPDVTLTVVNECETPGEEDQFGEVEIIKDANDPEESFSFSATWDADGFTLIDGGLEPSGLLLAGSSVTVTETLTAEQMLAGWSLVNIDCGDADVTVDGSSVTITVVANTTITCTFTNELEEQPDNGLVEIDKLFCFTDGVADTEFLVLPPTPLPTENNALGQVEGEQPDSGCWTAAVSFTITGGDLEAPLEWTTDENGNLEEVLPASENAYTITEDLTGESAQFFIEDGALTAIVVLNLVEEEEAGLVKVIKLFCETDDAAEAGVTFMVEGGDAPVPAISGCTLGDATFELGDLEIATEGGIAIELVPVGEYAFAETDPNVAEYDGMIEVELGEITTIIVFNTFAEGEQGGNPPGNGGSGPGQSETPREGTAGGNPLPNTATTPAPGGSLPAILLALMALGALGVGGHRVATEARSRR